MIKKKFKMKICRYQALGFEVRGRFSICSRWGNEKTTLFNTRTSD